MKEYGFCGKEPLQVSLVSVTSQSITCSISEESRRFYFSAIYGSNDGMERRQLWRHLQDISNNLSTEPWILAGDFNIISHPSESSKEEQEYTMDMRDFIACLAQIAVFDHAYSGPYMTWSNHQAEGFIARKIDRVLVNGSWYTCFDQLMVEFLPPEISDHCPVVIQLQLENYSPPKPFKFFSH